MSFLITQPWAAHSLQRKASRRCILGGGKLLSWAKAGKRPGVRHGARDPLIELYILLEFIVFYLYLGVIIEIAH